jgi:hypothetical protein
MSALAEALDANQGPTKLDKCEIDYSVLADGAETVVWRHHSSGSQMVIEEVLLHVDALRENRGLVDLNLVLLVSNETWHAICDSSQHIRHLRFRIWQ